MSRLLSLGAFLGDLFPINSDYIGFMPENLLIWFKDWGHGCRIKLWVRNPKPVSKRKKLFILFGCFWKGKKSACPTTCHLSSLKIILRYFGLTATPASTNSHKTDLYLGSTVLKSLFSWIASSSASENWLLVVLAVLADPSNCQSSYFGWMSSRA